ncbi:MAG: tRNA (N(6)-L-threonylcarbamoyladenosine(37)-C(2))-methylthiotransferase MtaB [Firmicutes bacterium]|nr:tRNA (N(6)-L-threonylcarbamoyladenosine(37)-C(2))-methylthiotransferase MtaB [Bacillota bacterium]
MNNPLRVSFYTLGCKVNQYETEAMREKFQKAGYDVVGDDAPADIYIINTCTVTNLADRKSRQFIRRAKRENPEAMIAVTGCYAQIDPEKVAEIPGVDIIAGTNEKQDIVKYVEKALAEKAAYTAASTIHVKPYSDLTDYCSDGLITAMESRTRAFVKIQEGCNRFCSYCIIPYARGKVRSRLEEEILEEVGGLVSKGFKEVVLTGINTALYGADRKGGLRELLKAIDEIPGDFRVRLSSLEPTVVGISDVESILDSKKLCSHLHLSIQSGSNNVLKAMNRRYTREKYLGIVKMLRERDPFFGITTDIIVGFPGETEEDFMDSVNLVKSAEFSKVHVFRYSPRKGTKAAEMPGQIPEQEKTRRAKVLSQAAEEASAAFLNKQIGQTVKVLIEEQQKSGLLVGYSDNYTRVFIKDGGAPTNLQPTNSDKNSNLGKIEGNSALLNTLIDVKLTNKYKDGMKGEILNV